MEVDTKRDNNGKKDEKENSSSQTNQYMKENSSMDLDIEKSAEENKYLIYNYN